MGEERSEDEATPSAPNAPETPAVENEGLKAADEVPLQGNQSAGVKGTDAPSAINATNLAGDGGRLEAGVVGDVGRLEAGGTVPVKEEERKEDPDEHTSAFREWFDLIVRAAFWALILYLFFFQVSVVDGPSMEPTFYTNDRLVIDKVTLTFSDIHRFDVVVFSAVDSERSSESKDYIKRVIGLPGETVEIKAGRVFIDGKLLEEPFEREPTPCYFGNEKYVVPPYHYFVMGDNRKDSKDSRTSGVSAGLGFVPYSQIRGIARLRFLPVGR